MLPKSCAHRLRTIRDHGHAERRGSTIVVWNAGSIQADDRQRLGIDAGGGRAHVDAERVGAGIDEPGLQSGLRDRTDYRGTNVGTGNYLSSTWVLLPQAEQREQ